MYDLYSIITIFISININYPIVYIAIQAWPLKPHSDVLDAIFSLNKMKALASFQDLYVGLEPYRNNNEFAGGVMKKTAPAVFGLLSALELHPTNEKAGGRVIT